MIWDSREGGYPSETEIRSTFWVMTAVNGSRIVIIERKEESQESNHIKDLGKNNIKISNMNYY